MITKLETTDIDELLEVQQWDVHYRPLRINRFSSKHVSGKLNSIHTEIENWKNPVEITGASPCDGLSLVIPLHESDAYRSRGMEITHNHVDIYTSSHELHAVMQPETSLLACLIPNYWLDSINDALIEPLQDNGIGEHYNIRPSTSSIEKLRSWLIQLLNIMERNNLNSAFKQCLEEETIDKVVQMFNSSFRYKTTVSKRFTLARQARDYMLDRKANPPNINEVCSELAISERSLHTIFKGIFGVSPKQFLKSQRLLAVHQLLKSAAKDEQVTNIALSMGFWDLGYFARDYKKMFGELPSITLQNNVS